MHKKGHLLFFPLVLISVLSFNLLTGCSQKQANVSTDNGSAGVSLDSMPVSVKSAPTTVQEAYQFAVVNPDTMKQIPCYCGCGSMGHTSNYSCYVLEADANGKVQKYDEHALGCSICVDITQDVMRLLKEKKTIQEIRAYVDNDYSKYGPSNMSGAIVPASSGSEHISTTKCLVNSTEPCSTK